MRLPVCVVACLLAASGIASAEPPLDQWGGFPDPMLSCIAKDDLQEIVLKQVHAGTSAADALYAEYNAQKTGKFPRCDRGYFPEVQVGKDFVDMGPVHDSKGNYVRVWLLHVGNSSYEGWVLYTESIPDKDT